MRGAFVTIKKMNFTKESAAKISYELDRIRTGLLQISELPTSADVDENEFAALLEHFSSKLTEFKKKVDG